MRKSLVIAGKRSKPLAISKEQDARRSLNYFDAFGLGQLTKGNWTAARKSLILSRCAI
ncbi:hypothetical protein HCJ80_08605 [Listeria grayi]|nr:hypothetical protein [Listeria grayi]